MQVNVHGVSYEYEVIGSGEPLLVLHGFTGSMETWRSFVPAWSDQFQVILVDIIGHGKTESPKETRHYNIETVAGHIIALLDHLQIEKAHMLGYSMGGRLALTLACLYPERALSLLLENCTAGLITEEERAERRQKDEQLAQNIEREGIAAFVEKWENIPLFATQKKLPLHVQARVREERLANDPEGLGNSLRGMGTGAQPSWWHELEHLQMPVLLMSGEYDEKFFHILTKMKKYIPHAEFVQIIGAGHAIHVEQPQKFDTIVMGFLQNIKGGRDKMTIEWVKEGNYEDIIYSTYNGIAKISINRPEVHNAFRPKTVMELIDAFAHARDDQNVGVIILTGEGGRAFCSGGDQKVRGHGGYVGEDQIPRLNVLDLQRLIRAIPKPVIAMVAGYAIGGGHVLHIVCDLTIAADNAVFGQTGPKVGSFDGGYGAGYLARMVGHKKAREIWYLCRQYNAQEALDMGLINTVVPLEQLEEETVKWAEEILANSPMALRFLKAAFNADTDGLAGIQQLAGDATLLYYTTDEAKEGRDAFKEKRRPDFGQFPRFP